MNFSCPPPIGRSARVEACNRWPCCWRTQPLSRCPSRWPPCTAVGSPPPRAWCTPPSSARGTGGRAARPPEGAVGGRGPAGSDHVPMRSVLDAVRAEGHRRVLTEGGPTLLAGLAAAGLLDELFLTLSPVLAGRRAGDGRLGLAEGAHL